RLHTYVAILCFYFLGHRAHRALHSFPTRRSSDLLDVGERARTAIASSRRQANKPPRCRWLGGTTHVGMAAANCAHDEPCALTRRSEEHTSELQSQSNLVCRLLLEKKKTLPTPTTP